MSGPGSAFRVLLEQDDTSGVGLPGEIREIYGGDWILPDPARIYHYSNFVMSHDGKVSFAVSGHEGGGAVSGFNAHDQWLMGLLRARADAVLVGANTLRTESEHLWTSDFIYPSDSALFHSLRAAEGREPYPLQVFLTRQGVIPPGAAVFDHPELRVVIVTTAQGATQLKNKGAIAADVVVAGDTEVDMSVVHRRLFEDYGVRTVLSEGGPSVYASLVQANQVDEEFLTLSPVVVRGSKEQYRPGLLDGWALEPGHSLRTNLVSVRQAGDHLFLRTRWSRSD
jgi:riboflavin biosynthesis pyrimidine reductase